MSGITFPSPQSLIYGGQVTAVEVLNEATARKPLRMKSRPDGENIYIRGFGSFITKKRAAKIGRNIKKNVAVEIPEHFIPAFKPAKEFVSEVKSKRKLS